MSSRPRAAGYVRVSTGAQAHEGLSLAEQRKRIKARAAEQDWELVRIYEDAGVSGRREDRPAMLNLLDDLDGIDKLLVVKLDRLGRRARGMLELFERLEAAGVALVSLGDNIDTSTATGRMIPKLMAVLADYESEIVGERVSAVVESRAKAGRHLGAEVYGYRKAGGKLEPIPHEAEVVRRIFKERAAGRSFVKIVRDLEDDKIKPKRAKCWYQGSISRMVRNPVYAGRVRLEDQEYEGAHEALVSSDLWEKVQERNRREREKKSKGRGRRPNQAHLLTDLLKCGLCDSPMVAREHSYRCYLRFRRGPSHCAQPNVPRAALDTAVFDYFESVGLDLEATRLQISQAVERGLEEVRATRAEAERAVLSADGGLERARRHYNEGRLKPEDYSDLVAGLKQDKAGARAQLEQAKIRERAVKAQVPTDAEQAVMERLAGLRAAIASQVTEGEDLDAVRAALQRLFAEFRVVPAPEPHAMDSEEAALVEWAKGEPLSAELGTEPIRGNGWNLLPIPRPRALDGVPEGYWLPVLRQEGLPLAANKGSHGSSYE